MGSYKLVTFEAADGPRAGMEAKDRVYDIAALTGRPAYATMLGVLADWPAADKLLRAAAGKPDAAGRPLAHSELVAPLPRPGPMATPSTSRRPPRPGTGRSSLPP